MNALDLQNRMTGMAPMKVLSPHLDQCWSWLQSSTSHRRPRCFCVDVSFRQTLSSANSSAFQCRHSDSSIDQKYSQLLRNRSFLGPHRISHLSAIKKKKVFTIALNLLWLLRLTFRNPLWTPMYAPIPPAKPNGMQRLNTASTSHSLMTRISSGEKR